MQASVITDSGLQSQFSPVETCWSSEESRQGWRPFQVLLDTSGRNWPATDSPRAALLTVWTGQATYQDDSRPLDASWMVSLSGWAATGLTLAQDVAVLTGRGKQPWATLEAEDFALVEDACLPAFAGVQLSVMGTCPSEEEEDIEVEDAASAPEASQTAPFSTACKAAEREPEHEHMLAPPAPEVLPSKLSATTASAIGFAVGALAILLGRRLSSLFPDGSSAPARSCHGDSQPRRGTGSSVVESCISACQHGRVARSAGELPATTDLAGDSSDTGGSRWASQRLQSEEQGAWARYGAWVGKSGPLLQWCPRSSRPTQFSPFLLRRQGRRLRRKEADIAIKAPQTSVALLVEE